MQQDAVEDGRLRTDATICRTQRNTHMPPLKLPFRSIYYVKTWCRPLNRRYTTNRIVVRRKQSHGDR